MRFSIFQSASLSGLLRSVSQLVFKSFSFFTQSVFLSLSLFQLVSHFSRFISLSVHQSIEMSVNPYVSLTIPLSVHQSVYRFVSLCLFVSVHLTVFPFASLSIQSFVCLLICPALSLSIHPSAVCA